MAEIVGWMAFKAVTPTRTFIFKAHTIEEAADLFMERFGYYPDINNLEPIIEKG